MVSEADYRGTGIIDVVQFKEIIIEQKKKQSADNEEDTMDAFVSMGGEPGGQGFIDAGKLIQIIKEQFQMTIDIEKLIQDIDEDGSGEIEYNEFKQLL